MGEFSLTHLLLLAVIFLIFFGPSRLPQLGQSLGKAIRGFKQGLSEIDAEAKDITQDQRNVTPQQQFQNYQQPQQLNNGYQQPQYQQGQQQFQGQPQYQQPQYQQQGQPQFQQNFQQAQPQYQQGFQQPQQGQQQDPQNQGQGEKPKA